MSMHLEGPWLSTTGKKKGRQRYASADAKRRAERLQQEWEERLGNFKKMAPKFSRTTTAPKPTTGTLNYKLTTPPGRETDNIPSRDTGWVPCVRPADKEYTGTMVKGIGTMHKSNAVPIFSDEEAKDISKMRR